LRVAASGNLEAVAVRLLLGIVAALRAVLIPGEAELLSTQPLRWPSRNPARRDGTAAVPGDRRESAGQVA
jgi:hypothetical protein